MTHPSFLRAGVLTALLAGSTSSDLLSQAPSVDGDWHASGLSAPTRLRESYYNANTDSIRFGENSLDFAQFGEQLVDLFLSSKGEITDLNLNFNSGAVTGDTTGTYTEGAQGRLNISIPGEVLAGYRNLSADTIIVPSLDQDDMSYNVLTKKPATLVVAELAGQWNVTVANIPIDFTEVYFNPMSGGTRLGVGIDDFAGPGEQLVDVFYPSKPELQQLSIAIDGAGNITGDVSGAASVNADRSVTFNLVGIGPLVFHPNTGKDVLVYSGTETDNVSFVVALKPAATPSLANLAGVWRWQSFDYPIRLRETYYNAVTDAIRTSVNSDDFAGANEQLVDVFFPGPLDTENDLVSIDASGTVTGSDPGTISIGGSTITFNSVEPDDPLSLFANASSDVMVGSPVSEDELNLVTLVKVDGEAAGSLTDLVELDLTIQPDGSVDANWNEATRFRLSKSTTLGMWNEVDGTEGSANHTDTSGATSGFFRIEIVD